MTELERELEASFIADLDNQQEEIKTAVLGPESAPTVLMPRDAERIKDIPVSIVLMSGAPSSW